MYAVVNASASKLGAFHKEVGYRIETIAARGEGRNQNVEESTQEGHPPTNDNEDEEPEEAMKDATSTCHGDEHRGNWKKLPSPISPVDNAVGITQTEKARSDFALLYHSTTMLLTST